jgi:hypothetical protein
MNERFDDIIKEARRKKRQKTIFTIVLNCRSVALSNCCYSVALSLCRAFVLSRCLSL